MDSILTSTKKLLGIAEEDTSFDTDIIMHINTVFSILTQLGVGPPEGFSIEDNSTVWTDYIQANPRLELIKSYMYMKVRLMFDPPLSSSVTQILNERIAELEWRINVTVDPGDGGDS